SRRGCPWEPPAPGRPPPPWNPPPPWKPPPPPPPCPAACPTAAHPNTSASTRASAVLYGFMSFGRVRRLRDSRLVRRVVRKNRTEAVRRYDPHNVRSEERRVGKEG